MADMADINAQDASATNVTFVKKEPASAGNPARWSADSISSAFGFRPVLQVSSKPTSKKDGRATQFRLSVPIIRDGVVVAYIPYAIDSVLPDLATATEVNDANNYCVTLFSSALIKSSFRDGFAPS